MQKNIVIDFRLFCKYASIIGRNLLPHYYFYHQTMSSLHVAAIFYFDVLHLVTERSSHRRWSIMLLKILQNSQENTCTESLRISLIHKTWVDLINKGILKNLANFTGKHLCLAWNYKESLFNKVTANQTCNLTKARLQHRCFTVKFMKFLRIPISKNICQQMLL